MTNRVLVLRKLALLRQRVAQARARRPASADALRSDDVLLDALALSVLIAVQEAIDIAFHMATDEGWGIPASYAESFDLLAKHAVLDPTLARAMTAAAGLRNRIAHAYATVDVDRLWGELPAGVDAIDQFAAAVARFLGPGAEVP
jgi:uncharacterized protein YutE (UPF0331/DUF86 family)